jgi:hypothetical protein
VTAEEDKDKDNDKQEIEIKPKPPIPINQELVNLFKPESDAITHNNMAKLTKQDSFLIADKTFNRRRLKPQQLVNFTKAYSEVTESTDDVHIEDKLKALEKAAVVALEDFTHEDFENTDVVVLENVLAACFLITKGFREV